MHSFTVLEARSKIRVLVGLVVSESFEGESAPGLSPSFRWWLAILGVPWLVAAPLSSLPSSPHSVFSVHLPLCPLSYYKDII